MTVLVDTRLGCKSISLPPNLPVRPGDPWLRRSQKSIGRKIDPPNIPGL